MRGCTLDDGHRLALSIAVYNWGDVTGQLRIILGHTLADDPEADELNDWLGSLQSRLEALHDDYAKTAPEVD